MDVHTQTAGFPGQRLQLFPAAAIWVSDGANRGDPIGTAGDCEPGDTYRLDRQAQAQVMLLEQGAAPDGAARVAPGSGIGAPGDGVDLAARLTLMAPDGERVIVLILRHVQAGHVYAFPMSPLARGTDYTLLAAEADPKSAPLADIVCVSLARGTTVTLPGGARRPIETLTPGDLVLTRDHGAQPLRWIGSARLRAEGAFAPVVISAGTLGNSGDLVVSQHHRMFLYQRGQRRIGQKAELLVQAKHLVDGDHVWLRDGGYTDYFSLIFDAHEIIYAEGIPCESLMVSEALLRRLPEDLAAGLRAEFPGLSHSQHFGTEAGREAVTALGPGALFRPGRN